MAFVPNGCPASHPANGGRRHRCLLPPGHDLPHLCVSKWCQTEWETLDLPPQAYERLQRVADGTTFYPRCPSSHFTAARKRHRCGLRPGHKGKHECIRPGCLIRWNPRLKHMYYITRVP